jgi:tetratricopeptide (TPR) repeat protein
MLVRDIALHYHIQIRTLSSNEVSLDFKSLFGRNIDAFYSRKDRIIESMWSWRIDDDSINIHAICMWLSVRDATTRTYLGDRAAAKARRDEYTCDWFQRPLLDFTRGEDDVLAITGPSGCGKSMLSGWIMERLQRPIGKKTYQTLSLSVGMFTSASVNQEISNSVTDIELPDQCTSLAISKNLALQLLQSNIGDVALLSALGDIHKKFLGCTDTAILENALWSAIHVGIDNSNADNLAIIVDGLDDRCGRQIALTISNRIAELASKHKRVQAIILTRNAAHFSRSKAHILAITPDHTHFDLQHIAVHALKGCQYYLNQKENEREAVVEKLTQAAKGNFLWVQLMAKILERETSHDGFMKAVKTAHDSPKSLEQLMKSLVFIATADFTNTESNRLLSWLLVSQRPLTVREIKALLEVDIQKKTLVARHSDAEENIRAWCGLLIRIQNGIVHFRHDAIREQLLEISAEGKKLRNYQLLQSDFTVRLLAYCRLRLTNPHSACFDRPEVEGDMFLHDALLEYASRNWIFHFKKSSQYKANGTFELHSDLKVLFPTSVQLPMIEWSCWESQTSGFEAATLHDLALRIRQEILTEKHESVLQTLIICGHLQRKLSMTEQAGAYFYLASRIGQLVLKAYSTITLSCTTAFLEVTETVSCTTRTEFVTHKEECLQYIISVYIHQHGKTSDIVIKYYKMLAELYVSIHEEDKAEMCWKELREIMVIRYGKGSSEETTICGHLKVVLKKGESHEEIIEYERNIFDTTCEMEIWDLRRIEITLKMAVTYEAHGHLLKAEECYVLLWSGLIEYCHQFNRNHHVDIEVHISMIDISLEYVRFLRRHNRHEEAAGILICIWAEYEEYEFESEIVFLRLKVIGELMRSINLLSIAVSVFKKCWSWFKSHGKHEHISSCQILISETIEEIVTTETKSVTTSTTITTTTESIIREVFESSISKSTVTTETISICQSFISLYMKSEQWVEAITASTQSLELIWRLVITGRGTVALPRDFSSEAIDIAIRLAICHHRSNHFHEAEEVYLRIYRACFSSCHIHDERFTKAYTCLVKFYEEHGHWDKVVQIYQEILVASRKHLGVSHALTLKILYSLGDLCSKHGHGHAHEYYEEIIAVLNGSSTVCHHESFRAMEIMCRVYYEQGHWEKLRVNCEVLWETWIHHHKSHKIDARFIELLYMRYIYVLEKHYHVEYEVIRRVTIEFRDTCLLVFGASVAITIRALIELAQICTRSEKYIHEAISYYEEVSPPNQSSLLLN